MISDFAICKYIDLKSMEGTRANLLITLVFLNFIDTSFFPLPAQTFLFLLIFSDSGNKLKYITMSFIASIIGAMAGYLAGVLVLRSGTIENNGFMHFLITNIPAFKYDSFLKVENWYSKWNIWILITSSVIPVPYAVFSLGSGLFGISPLPFFIMTSIAQFLKFFVITNLISIPGLRVIDRFKKMVNANRLFKMFTVTIVIIVIVKVVIL